MFSITQFYKKVERCLKFQIFNLDKYLYTIYPKYQYIDVENVFNYELDNYTRTQNKFINNYNSALFLLKLVKLTNNNKT